MEFLKKIIEKAMVHYVSLLTLFLFAIAGIGGFVVGFLSCYLSSNL